MNNKTPTTPMPTPQPGPQPKRKVCSIDGQVTGGTGRRPLMAAAVKP